MSVDDFILLISTNCDAKNVAEYLHRSDKIQMESKRTKKKKTSPQMKSVSGNKAASNNSEYENTFEI